MADIEDPVTPGAEEPDDTVVAVDDGKGGKSVDLAVYLHSKKEAKALALRVKELEPIAARSQEIDARLVAAQPIIDAIVTNPKLRAEALRMAQGTRVSSEYTQQPEDDEDAKATAEEFGFYMNDGHTPDAARGRRVLDRMDKRTQQRVDAGIRPLAGATLSAKAEHNFRQAMSETDAHGVPLATPESIREVWGSLPPHLLADPSVVRLVVNNAIGEDRRNGRTPREQDEPLYMASAGSGRGNRENVISADEKEFLSRYGISEKDYAASNKRLEDGVNSRKGIQLGGK